MTATGLPLVWLTSRQDELRREDVLVWVNQTIEALQSQFLICLAELEGTEVGGKDRMTEIYFSTSILIEQGRMFFRNAKPGEYGQRKPPAYRGFRPCILDHLVVAHQIAIRWPNADGGERLLMRQISEDCVKAFVSLAQKEVGRDRTASADTSAGGNGANLDYLMGQATNRRSDHVS